MLFNRYRDLTQLDFVKSANTSSFIQTIKPFLILSRQLPEVTRNTKNFSDIRTLDLREAIVNATDPEKLFFEDFPAYQQQPQSLNNDKTEDLNYSFLAKLFSSLADSQKEKIFQVLRNTRNLEKKIG